MSTELTDLAMSGATLLAHSARQRGDHLGTILDEIDLITDVITEHTGASWEDALTATMRAIRAEIDHEIAVAA